MKFQKPSIYYGRAKDSKCHLIITFIHMAALSWTQLEKLTLAFIRKPTEKNRLAYDKAQGRAKDFLEKLTFFFIQNHPGLEGYKAVFIPTQEGQCPEWGCRCDEETREFRLNLVGIFRFLEECRHAHETMNLPEGRANFSVYRMNAYKDQLQKLPPQMMMFLLLFQEEARILEVAQEERKRASRAEVSPLDMEYIHFLWAFRELEKVYRCLKGVELKSDLQFVWHETEWTSGNK